MTREEFIKYYGENKKVYYINPLADWAYTKVLCINPQKSDLCIKSDEVIVYLDDDELSYDSVLYENLYKSRYLAMKAYTEDKQELNNA